MGIASYARLTCVIQRDGRVITARLAAVVRSTVR
jgi:hypothetical protein